ncbi:unnamed protein product [Peniophora sp. CBMAI 1063]|nr:unnamed protein product [Peniophora sp. CBMAI 1063]
MVLVSNSRTAPYTLQPLLDLGSLQRNPFHGALRLSLPPLSINSPSTSKLDLTNLRAAFTATLMRYIDSTNLVLAETDADYSPSKPLLNFHGRNRRVPKKLVVKWLFKNAATRPLRTRCMRVLRESRIRLRLIDIELPDERKMFIKQDSGAKFVLDTDEVAGTIFPRPALVTDDHENICLAGLDNLAYLLYTSVPAPRFELLTDLRAHVIDIGITHAGMAPSTIEALLDTAGGLPIKYLASGGEKITGTLLQKWSARADLLLANFYGYGRFACALCVTYFA